MKICFEINYSVAYQSNQSTFMTLILMMWHCCCTAIRTKSISPKYVDYWHRWLTVPKSSCPFGVVMVYVCVVHHGNGTNWTGTQVNCPSHKSLGAFMFCSFFHRTKIDWNLTGNGNFVAKGIKSTAAHQNFFINFILLKPQSHLSKQPGEICGKTTKWIPFTTLPPEEIHLPGSSQVSCTHLRSFIGDCCLPRGCHSAWELCPVSAHHLSFPLSVCSPVTPQAAAAPRPRLTVTCPSGK